MPETGAPRPILEARSIAKSFGATPALVDGNLVIRPGSIHALLGENGAGKSTLIKIIAGAVRADGGDLALFGEPVHLRDPGQALELGVGVVYQELSLFPDLTVAENITLNDRSVRKAGVFRWRAAETTAARVLARLGDQAEQIGPRDYLGDLRIDQRQLVEIAKVLHSGARIVILDEPTSSLSRPEVEALFVAVRRIAAEGVGFIFVSHRLAEVRELCDRVTVLRNGQSVIFDVDVSSISDGDLVRAMAGSELTSILERQRTGASSTRSRELLRCQYRLDSGGEVQEIVVHEGEIVGLAGLAGSGRSTLLETLFGSKRLANVEIELDGHRRQLKSPRDGIAHGIAYVGEDRRRLGIFEDLPISETLMMPLRVGRKRRIVPLQEREVDDLIRRVGIVARGEQEARTLSGGNQQKATLARWLPLKPKLYLLDEPTRGIDVRAKAELHALMSTLAEEGAGILVVSSEIPELVSLCDRVIVLSQGRVVATLDTARVSEGNILDAMAGAI